jgi:hypothetical protein
MDPQVFDLARQLQAKLAQINERADRDAFHSVHGMLIKLVDGIETAMPELREKREKDGAKADREKVKRLLKKMKLEGDLPDDPDSLEQIARELAGEDPDHPVGVPAKRKPGPKGLTGGVALPLPESDSIRS